MKKQSLAEWNKGEKAVAYIGGFFVGWGMYELAGLLGWVQGWGGLISDKVALLMGCACLAIGLILALGAEIHSRGREIKKLRKGSGEKDSPVKTGNIEVPGTKRCGIIPNKLGLQYERWEAVLINISRVLAGSFCLAMTTVLVLGWLKVYLFGFSDVGQILLACALFFFYWLFDSWGVDMLQRRVATREIKRLREELGKTG